MSEFTVTFSVSQSLSTLGISIFINTPTEIVGVFIKIIFFHSKCINHLNLKKVIKVKHSHNVGETALRSASVRYCPLDGAADA